MTVKIEIYYRPMCGFCDHAINFFKQKNLEYTAYNIWEEDKYQQDMKNRAPNSNTVPQIFINDTHIGGCDNLIMMADSGKLKQKFDI